MWVSKMEYDALLQTVEDTNKLVREIYSDIWYYTHLYEDLKEQFDEEKKASLTLKFADKNWKITYLNCEDKDYGEYQIADVTVDGEKINFVPKQHDAILPKNMIEKLSGNETHLIEVVLA